MPQWQGQSTTSSQTHVSGSQMIYIGWYFSQNQRGLFFSSQLTPIKCDNLCGAQNLNHVTTVGCCHSSPGCYLASYQRVASGCGFLSYLRSTLQHIHLNAVSAPAYKTGQHFTTHLQQAALDLHNKSPWRLSMSTKQTLFQKLMPNL